MYDHTSKTDFKAPRDARDKMMAEVKRKSMPPSKRADICLDLYQHRLSKTCRHEFNSALSWVDHNRGHDDTTYVHHLKAMHRYARVGRLLHGVVYLVLIALVVLGCVRCCRRRRGLRARRCRRRRGARAASSAGAPAAGGDDPPAVAEGVVMTSVPQQEDIEEEEEEVVTGTIIGPVGAPSVRGEGGVEGGLRVCVASHSSAHCLPPIPFLQRGAARYMPVHTQEYESAALYPTAQIVQ